MDFKGISLSILKKNYDPRKGEICSREVKIELYLPESELGTAGLFFQLHGYTFCINSLWAKFLLTKTMQFVSYNYNHISKSC